MHYDDEFPTTALAVIADPNEDAGLRADAGAGIREYARRRVDALGEAGIRKLIDQLGQASQGGTDALRQTADRVSQKLESMLKVHRKPARGGVR
jgi:hypothetical protein